jgi:hypothetical protein
MSMAWDLVEIKESWKSNIREDITRRPSEGHKLKKKKEPRSWQRKKHRQGD